VYRLLCFGDCTNLKLQPRLWVPIALLSSIVFYIGLYVWGAQSDGYKFLDQTIRSAPSIRERLGDVATVRLSFFGGYRDKTAGSTEWLTMTLHVAGQKGTATVVAEAKKTNEVWSVTNASINGDPVKLN
jgi:Cytochrome oxidase complex assembly protein 1